jgi:hypothetical protein
MGETHKNPIRGSLKVLSSPANTPQISSQMCRAATPRDYIVEWKCVARCRWYWGDRGRSSFVRVGVVSMVGRPPALNRIAPCRAHHDSPCGQSAGAVLNSVFVWSRADLPLVSHTRLARKNSHARHTQVTSSLFAPSAEEGGCVFFVCTCRRVKWD